MTKTSTRRRRVLGLAAGVAAPALVAAALTLSTAAQSTAAQSTAAQSTAAQSTAAQSTASQSTADQSTAAQSTAAQSSARSVAAPSSASLDPARTRPTMGATDERALRQAAQRLVDAGATGVILRVDDGHRVTRFAVGAARLEPRRALAPDDEFRIGSNTKTFVATVTLQLVAERRLGLDDTVERWLPGLIPNGDEITLRMLLGHTSGLFDYTESEAFGVAAGDSPDRVDHVFTPREVIGYATAEPPAFAPGGGWAYSNTNYVVVGMIIEKATGRTLADLIDRRIARPLGLSHTYVASSEVFRGRHAHGYLTPADTGAGYLDVSGRNDAGWAWAAGAMISTADDLARFESALLSGRLLPPAQLRAMKALNPASRDQVLPGATFGLGLLSVKTSCGTLWGHLGSIPGYRSRSYSDVAGQRTLQLLIPTESTEGIVTAADDLQDAAACRMFGH